MCSTPVSEEVEWGERRCLIWDDFSGDIDLNEFEGFVAVSCLRLDYTIECNPDGDFYVDAVAIFRPQCSWARPEGKTDYILNHEQRHFDITRIYAERLEFVCNVNYPPTPKAMGWAS